VLAAAREWAGRLASGPGLSIGLTKMMVSSEWNLDVVAAVEAEAAAQALMMMGADHRAFFDAFKEKRKPEFTGR
jgi:hypothetical protein